MSLIRKHGAVLQAWACLALVTTALAIWLNSVYFLNDRLDNLSARAIAIAADFASRTETRCNAFGHFCE